MTETASLPLGRPRRFHFDWLLPALFRPRPIVARVMTQAGDSWLTPLLVLMLASLARALAAGWLKQLNPGQVTLPPDFQYWPPQQQTQFMEGQAALQGPAWVYVFPAVFGLLEVWAGWLLVTGLLHLVLTLMGGRGSTRAALNLVAWAGLPFAVRDLVRAAAMLATRQLIQHPGLSGFAPSGASGWIGYLGQVLQFVDLYLLWYAALLVLGVRASDTLPAGKALAGVAATVLAMLLLQAVPGFLAARFSGLSFAMPFFF